jgi:hypothetical protein
MIDSNPFDLPPYPYLSLILNHCSRAASTYITLWRERDKNGIVKIRPFDIRSTFLITPTRFKNDLLVIAKEGLISVTENSKEMIIEVIGWDDEADFE